MMSIRTGVLYYLQRRTGGMGSAVGGFRAGAPFSSPSPRFYGRSRARRGRAIRRRPVKKATATVVSDDMDVPSRSMVKSMPVSLKGMDNTSLTTLGAMGNHAALQEMVKRHVMATDDVGYQEASDICDKIEKKNHDWENYMAFPFQANIIMCFTAGVISIPLVFHLPTVEFFNEHFVTAEHPPTKELETALEVGSWSWNWMEPVMGTATFLLLSLQYLR